MASLADIRDWVRQQTLIETDDFADSKLNAVINQGVRKLGTLRPWPFLEETTSFTIEDGQDYYDLPEDFNRLISVMDDTGRNMSETSRRRALIEYGIDTENHPERFYIFREKMYFVPSPDSTYEITLDYLRNPNELTADAEEPEWYGAFHLLLGEYAASKVWEREEDLDKAQLHMANFYGEAEEMALHYQNRGVDDPLVVGTGTRRSVLRPYDWQRNDA